MVTIKNRGLKVGSKPKARMTLQKQVIMAELRTLSSHPTADELYKIVRRKLSSVSLGTVYRNLEQMARSGLIQKLGLCGNQKRFDGRPEAHLHARCDKCNKVIDLHLRITSPLKGVRKSKEFYITGYRLKFTGLCPKCKKGETK